MRARGRRTGSRIVAALLTVMAVVVFGGFLYLQAWPPILVVMSSSMEPAIDTGSIVLMRHVEDSPEWATWLRSRSLLRRRRAVIPQRSSTG